MSAIGLSFAIIFAIGVPDEYRERIDSAFVEQNQLDDSAKSRPHFWSMAESMAQRNFLGVGVGCFKSNYNAYDISGGRYGKNRSVHSSHHSILAEIGYPGFLLWCLILLTTYLTLFRVRSSTKILRKTNDKQRFYFELSNALIASQTVFVIGGTFYEMAYNDFTWLIFGITIAMSRLHKSTNGWRKNLYCCKCFTFHFFGIRNK